jgi:hypothetical protein
MSSSRKKTWLSVTATAALMMSLGVLQFSTVDAAPGDDAFDVPGIASLNTGFDAWTEVVSCPSAGNCSAGGNYYTATGGSGVFVVSQVDGVWGTAIVVPGLAALNQGEDARIRGLSCASAGNCSAGGYYSDAAVDGLDQGFVVSQVDGVWGTAIGLPGLAALNTNGDAEVNDVACGSPGNCVAVGEYKDSDGDHGFVATQMDGVWGTAIPAPGLLDLDVTHDSEIDSVSCAATGECSAVGYYNDSNNLTQSFAVSLVNGTWGTARTIPGLAALNTDGDSQLNTVSCTSAGSCSAGGDYDDAVDGDQAFVVSQVDGVWGTATALPGLAALNTGNDAVVSSISCTTSGYCTAVGYYETVGEKYQGFVATQTNGTWGVARDVPGLVTLNTGGDAEVESVDCVSPGNCVGGGYYYTADGDYFAFYSVQTEGTWSDAIRTPGLPTLPNTNEAEVREISCATDGTCVAGGYYQSGDDPDNDYQAYLFEIPIIPGGVLQTVTPARLVETREGPNDETVDGLFEGIRKVDADSVTRFQVAGRAGIPEGAAAAMLTVAAILPDGPGHFTVWSCEGDPPLATNLNHGDGGVVANAVLTPLNDDGEACIYSVRGVNLTVDVNGYIPGHIHD